MKFYLCFVKVFIFGVMVFQPGTLLAQTVVQGQIQFDGTAPPVEKVEVKSDSATCGSVQQVQTLVLGKDHGIQDAVVKIVGATGELLPRTGKLDQKDCQFVPHVQVHPLGSTVEITSSDPVLHNSHGFYEDGSTAFNLAVPIVGMKVPAKLNKPGVIKLRCDAGHTWMSAYLVTSETPYFALTDQDGYFKIEGVPPGDYEIEIWQEWLGVHRESIHVDGEGTTVNITLKKS
ncbi:MAG: hypothetical protein COV74_04845 [Candidatus Omnitrophica bacterium CG11_big_fil_rev_8_21_14_0_20_45_26]|uniref:Rhamnogalacturonan lyase domain-containing protein n=1 Tax=Candidatus Abzuiibacterium crystallinum TaxID=1974748 RepID=A0A2H0LPN0_9BACT|nr:MAG: hypothetical protein COV74_04845 [Candidatus Omnitrophica bacterium CG11_big_fil_rev_8_21_14_0_20_45_26]PIW63588.1 MAG: hypothetical protein COW12_09760 [Candidatus Omnitrophica bacterium CG12_big_fil_rev_8_21_14_0_65_45_16]